MHIQMPRPTESRPIRPSRGRLLAGLSTIALLASGALADPAAAQSSAAQLQQSILHPASRPASAATNPFSAAATAQAVLSTQNFARAAQALTAAQAAQSAARTAAQTMTAAQATQAAVLSSSRSASQGSQGSTVVPGTTPCTTPGPLCGLVPDTSNPGNWVSVTVPTGASINLSDPNHPTETVVQTDAKGIATWKTFNLAPNEILDILQPSSSSILLNRIGDANPSLIRGQINANGQIYLINQNGIIFGGTSQINVNSLIASSSTSARTVRRSPTATPSLNTGIGALQQSGSSILSDFSSAHVAGDTNFEGASSSRKAPRSNSSQAADQPGFVYLFAPYVREFRHHHQPDGRGHDGGGTEFHPRQGVRDR